MGRGDERFAAAAARYVCAKVTDLREIDVAAVRFDFDLTLAVLLMHADGTIYHRYGGRRPDSADGMLSLPALIALLDDTLPEHRAYSAAPAPPKAPTPQRAIDLPALQQRLRANEKIDCVHCHTINDAETEHAMTAGSFAPDHRWVHPDPARIGLELDPERQQRVAAVATGSPAAKVGLQPGDVLGSLGAQGSVLTFSDVAFALHGAPATAAKLPVAWRRGDVAHRGELELPAGWKQAPPDEYAWRPFKWNLSPSPGFGGKALDAAERQRLGLGEAKFALRVQYLVDWGRRAHRGRAAGAAGLRKGDVLLSFGGKDDFTSMDHFHAWVCLTRTAGERIRFTVLRDGQRHEFEYELPR